MRMVILSVVMVILSLGMVMATLNLQGNLFLPRKSLRFNWWQRIKLKLLEVF